MRTSTCRDRRCTLSAVSSAMPILAGVGMQLRNLSRTKQRTIVSAAEVIADFALVYYAIASKRRGHYARGTCVQSQCIYDLQEH